MRGTSRASLAEAKKRLTAALAGVTAAQAGELGEQLLGVVGLLDEDPGLRRAFSDPSRDASAKAGLAEELFRGKVSAATLAQVTGLVSGRWSAPGDLADAAEQLAVLAIADAADVAGQLDDLEDELFRFSRVVQGSPDLRSALSNEYIPAQRRQDIVTALLDGKVTESALRLVTLAAVQPRRRSLDASLESYARLAAELRERLIAEVRVALPLSDAQRSRLTAALVGAYGHNVHLNVVLDPQVLGGMSVRIGDQLIDGSAASRLAELRRKLAA